MAETNGSLQLQQQKQENPTFQSLFHALDPISLLLSQNSDPQKPVSLQLISESYFMERGPRYAEYAELRESKLRKKNARTQEENEVYEPKQSPLKKQVKFQGNLTGSRKGPSVHSVLTQSVPDFSATLRKENRKPVSGAIELTPPAKNSARINGNLSISRGSKSANAGEKRGGMMARKSYASIEELKGLSMGVTKDICGESRGRTGRAGVGKTVLGSRHFY